MTVRGMDAAAAENGRAVMEIRDAAATIACARGISKVRAFGASAVQIRNCLDTNSPHHC